MTKTFKRAIIELFELDVKDEKIIKILTEKHNIDEKYARVVLKRVKEDYEKYYKMDDR